jgi:hypothetical protein
MLLVIPFFNSPTSTPSTNFSKLGWIFLGLFPQRRLPHLRPCLYGHHVRRGSMKKAKMILMDQMTTNTLVITWAEAPWAPMSGQPSSRIGTASKCTYGSCRPGSGGNGQPGIAVGSVRFMFNSNILDYGSLIIHSDIMSWSLSVLWEQGCPPMICLTLGRSSHMPHTAFVIPMMSMIPACSIIEYEPDLPRP